MLQVNINGEYYNTMKLINGEWIMPISHIKKKNRKKFYIISDKFYMNLMYKYMYKYKNNKIKLNRLFSSKFILSSLIKTNKDYKYIYIAKFNTVKYSKGIKLNMYRGYMKK